MVVHVLSTVAENSPSRDGFTVSDDPLITTNEGFFKEGVLSRCLPLSAENTFSIDTQLLRKAGENRPNFL